jgi:hypothetical protein
MAKELDTFLDGEEAGQAEAEQPSAATDTPEAVIETAAEPREPLAKATPEAEPAKEDDEHPVPDDVAGLRAAVQAERARRRDYKGERDRLAGEMAALKAQLEATRAPPPPAPVQQAPPQPEVIPNPVEDPQGYHDYMEARADHKAFNGRLNLSEALLRQQHDHADVEAKIAVFKKAAAANPALRAELSRQPLPYHWAYQQAEKLMALEEIGDPAAYRSKLETEIRAKLEAEYAGTQPQAAAPRIQLPQSLGTARSAAPRSNAVINVPEDFNDILRTARR